jgi:hypothetical protein
MEQKVIFFRNDDVRNIIEDELQEFVSIFTELGLPLTLAVEPANLTRKVVKWLIDLQDQFPEIIEIIQHGYDHNVRGLFPKSVEFGGNRSYECQLHDISKGKKLMDEYFPDRWFSAMAFPYDSYNASSLRALETLNYKIMGAMVHYTLKHKVKDYIGNVISRDFILRKKVSYHHRVRKRYNFIELSPAVNIIKKYITEDEAIHYSLDEILEQIEYCFKYTNVVGILFHHRFHTQEFEMIREMINRLMQKGYQFSSLENLHADFLRANSKTEIFTAEIHI